MTKCSLTSVGATGFSLRGSTNSENAPYLESPCGLRLSICQIFFAVLIGSNLVAQTTHPQGPTQEQLHVWLNQLGDPSFEVRQQAVKQLYSAGPAALVVLNTVSPGDDFEAALRARKLIERIQKLYLVGAQVEIAIDRKICKWDQPLALTIKIANASGFPVHLPFLITSRELLDVDPLSRQVGNLLDAADFLSVIGPDGRSIEPTIDDFRGHSSIEDALDVRVYGEPDSWLAPRASFSLTLQEFNRGFARYRMLEAGEYHLQFIYVPEWDQPVMRRFGVGKVISNEIVLKVTHAAPKYVRRADREIQVSLRLEGGDITLTLSNTYDRPMGVNLNLGGRGSSEHAHVEWIWNTSAGNKKVFEPFPEATAISAEKFKTLEVGESVELFRAKLSDLIRLRGFEELAGQPGKVRLGGAYVNRLDHAALARPEQRDLPLTARQRVLLRALPRPTFVGASMSRFIEIDAREFHRLAQP